MEHYKTFGEYYDILKGYVKPAKQKEVKKKKKTEEKKEEE